MQWYMVGGDSPPSIYSTYMYSTYVDVSGTGSQLVHYKPRPFTWQIHESVESIQENIFYENDCDYSHSYGVHPPPEIYA